MNRFWNFLFLLCSFGKYSADTFVPVHVRKGSTQNIWRPKNDSVLQSLLLLHRAVAEHAKEKIYPSEASPGKSTSTRTEEEPTNVDSFKATALALMLISTCIPPTVAGLASFNALWAYSKAKTTSKINEDPLDKFTFVLFLVRMLETLELCISLDTFFGFANAKSGMTHKQFRALAYIAFPADDKIDKLIDDLYATEAGNDSLITPDELVQMIMSSAEEEHEMNEMPGRIQQLDQGLAAGGQSSIHKATSAFLSVATGGV